jgi:hypothetical protein
MGVDGGTHKGYYLIFDFQISPVSLNLNKVKSYLWVLEFVV